MEQVLCLGVTSHYLEIYIMESGIFLGVGPSEATADPISGCRGSPRGRRDDELHRQKGVHGGG